jgi:hypothetical protein
MALRKKISSLQNSEDILNGRGSSLILHYSASKPYLMIESHKNAVNL